MTDPSPYPDTNDDTSGVPDHESPPGTPLWVKVFGIVLLVLILLIVIMLLIGGGHGPSRHMPSGSTGGYIPPVAYRTHHP